MGRKRKELSEPVQLGPATTDPFPSAQLREITTPETFRVFHCPSDPHHVGEFVVTVDTDGVRIWESCDWNPLDRDAHDGYELSWHELELIAGKGNAIVDDIHADIREIQIEMQTWVSIRAREANRIARAREVQRTENVRHLIDRADVVLSSWMKSPPRPMGTWRQMVARGRERSTSR